MKRKIIIFLSITASLLVVYCAGIYVINNVFHAYHGKITLKVVDNDGHVVTNANVAVYFANQLFRNREYYNGVTDEKGCFSAKGMSQGDILYQITKKGYYKTENSYWFTKEGTTERDKLRPWMTKYTPWNPNLEITLREIRNPIPMYYKNVEIEIPNTNVFLGFDFKKADWVKPYGAGQEAHVNFLYTSHVIDPWTFKKKLVISGNSFLPGVQGKSLNNYSEFKNLYNAPETGYTNKLIYTLNRTRTNIIENVNLDTTECVHVKYNNKANNVYYGVILPRLQYGSMAKRTLLRFNYVFNPTANDRNLEWNGSNLFDNTQWECHPSQERGRLK